MKPFTPQAQNHHANLQNINIEKTKDTANSTTEESNATEAMQQTNATKDKIVETTAPLHSNDTSANTNATMPLWINKGRVFGKMRPAKVECNLC